jgi:hypothetical protein
MKKRTKIVKRQLSELHSLSWKQRLKLHRQLTGGCVRLELSIIFQKTSQQLSLLSCKQG